MKKILLFFILFTGVFPVCKDGKISIDSIYKSYAQSTWQDYGGDGTRSNPFYSTSFGYGLYYNATIGAWFTNIPGSSGSNSSSSSNNSSSSGVGMGLSCEDDPFEFIDDLFEHDQGDDDQGGDDNSGSGSDDDPRSNNPGAGEPVCPTIKFSEEATQSYGFDDVTALLVDFKSVEEKQFDFLNVKIDPADYYNRVDFFIDLPSELQLDPPIPSSGDYKLKVITNPAGINGLNLETVKVLPRCLATDPPTELRNLWISIYPRRKLKVLVRIISSSVPENPTQGYNSHGLTEQEIEDFLNKTCYNQGVVEWDATVSPSASLDFDINRDGHIQEPPPVATDSDVPAQWSNEQQLIIDNYSDLDNYDVNIFFVDNPSTNNSLGISKLGSRIGFVSLQGSPVSSTSTSWVNPDPKSSVAHEIGHAFFSFEHMIDEKYEKYIMYRTNNGNRTKFNSTQWDGMHQ